MRWYWIISALCLVSAIFIMAGVKDKHTKREIQVIRTEALFDISANDWQVAAKKYKGVIDSGMAKNNDWFMYGLSLHYLKSYDQSISAFRTAIQKGYDPALPTYNIACGYSLSGNKTKAIEYFKDATEFGFQDTEYFESDPDLDPIRSEPEFIAILKNLKENRNQNDKDQSTLDKEN